MRTVFLVLIAIAIQRCTGCVFCNRLTQHQQQIYRTLGSPRPFGNEKPTRAQEFNRTGVLHPEYQIPATLKPGNVSQFYYLSPREGPPLTLLVSPCTGPISWTVSYVEPPESPPKADGVRLKTLKPGSPLFTYEGAEDRNFTIERTRAGLYWFEIKSMDTDDELARLDSPSTVLLYATSSGSEHIPGLYDAEKETRHRTLKFHQRRSRRRLTISWSKSNVDPRLSTYCLAVTSGNQPHPSTLCAAQNFLKIHHRSPRVGTSPRERYRGLPEGLHCVRQTKLTLHKLKYDTTYNFTLYVVNMRNNVSNRVAMDAIKIRKTPELILRTGRYTMANLHKMDGFVNFRYRPPDNTSTIFHILPCGGGSVKARLSAPDILREKDVAGYASMRVPPLPPGKIYTLHISTTPQELLKVSSIKVLATQESSSIYPQIPSRSMPREYKSLRTCNEVTVGIEPAGAARYCILVRELRSTSMITGVATIPDQCDLHRRRRSEYTYEVCKERQSQPRDKMIPFTLKKLLPGKAYLLQITAQLKGQFLSYPLLSVRTRRTCTSN